MQEALSVPTQMPAPALADAETASGRRPGRFMSPGPLMAVVMAAVMAIGCTSGSSAGRAYSGSDPASERPSGTTSIHLEVLEGSVDTAMFHIGAPLLLRMSLPEGAACEAFNGYPFFFDASGAQLGWGFEEVTDSLLFPGARGRCERILLLSSAKSNRLAEGVFSLRVELFVDEKTTLRSNTILLHPKRSAGADETSYVRFLQEQIIRNEALLRSDPETVAALFADGVPSSAESEIYRAVVLYRMGDIDGTMRALSRSARMTSERGRTLTTAAERTRAALAAQLGIPADEAQPQ